MLAEEARAAMRAAQAAQRAAQQAHAAAQMVLAGLEAASSPAPSLHAAHANSEVASHAAAAAQADADPFAAMRLQPLEEQQPPRNSAGPGESDFSAPAQPLPANLIQFPREMVAARRMRPRRAEGPLASLEPTAQLSIFEVDPAAVSTQPAGAVAEGPAAPEWMRRPEWPAADLDPQFDPQSGAQTQEEPITPPAPPTANSPVVDLAPFARRLLAIVIDGSLTLAAALGVLALMSSSGVLSHSPRVVSLAAALVLLLVCGAYQALFSALDHATPGMWYASMGLCTLDGCVASRAQRLRRLLVLPLSVLPLGLGLAWSLFDEDRLTWHDRLSGTYPRLR